MPLSDFFKNRYKIDNWAWGQEGTNYISAWYRPWWSPMYFRCNPGSSGMHLSTERAEEDAKKHATKIPKKSNYKYLGRL